MDNIARFIDDLNSTDITTERIATFKESLESLDPQTSTKIVVEKLLPHVFKSDIKIRKELLNLINDCENIETKYLSKADAIKFKLQCKQEFVEAIDKLRLANNSDWSILCIALFRILGTALHNDVEIINRILRIVENGFRNKCIYQKCEAYECWKELIRNYSLVPSYMKQTKQLKLLIKPLKVPLSRHASVVEIRFETFILLLEAMGTDAKGSYVDFLQFVFHFGNISASETTAVLPGYKNIWPKSTAILFQSLGCEGSIEYACNYKTTISPLIDNKYFESNYKLVVYSVRICSELLYQWCPKPNVKQIIEPLWTALFKLSRNSAFEKDVLLNISEHFNELFRLFSSNEFVYDFILMPILEIVYKYPEMNTAIFRSDVVIPFLKLYISHTERHIPNRNDALSKLVSFVYSSHTLSELYSMMESLNYSEVFELIWFQCNQFFLSEVKDQCDEEQSITKANILAYLKWPVGNIKYLNTNECTLKLWESTIRTIHQSEPDIISQLLDALKLIQQAHNWIIVNIMIISTVLLEVATRKTTTMECITLTLSDCLQNSANAVDQFVLYKRYFFQSYMTVLKHMVENPTALSTMFQSFDKFVQNLPDIIIKSIPETFVIFMESLSKLSNSNDAMSIVTRLRPQTLYTTPTIISRAKKMASFHYSPLLPNSSKAESKHNLDGKKKTDSLSANTDISGFEHNLESSPHRIKSSFIDKINKKNAKSATKEKVVINTRTKNIMEYADNVFIHIDKEVTPDLKKMSAHQRDATRRRRDDIPALYSDLSQSQSQNISPSDTISSQNIESIINRLDDDKGGKFDLESSEQTNVVETDEFNDVDNATNLTSEELSIQTEDMPRKKLFNDDSETDSSSLTDNDLFKVIAPRRDLFNVAGDDDSNPIEFEDVKSIFPKAAELNAISKEVLTKYADVDIVSQSDNILKTSPNKRTMAEDEELDDSYEEEMKMRLSAKKQNRITRQRRQCKSVEYFQNRSYRSSKSKSTSPSPKRKNKKNSQSNGSKSLSKIIESLTKLKSNCLQSESDLFESANNAEKKPDVIVPNRVSNKMVRYKSLPVALKAKSISVTYKSKDDVKSSKKGRVKFVAKWDKNNMVPAKTIVDDKCPIMEQNDGYHKQHNIVNEPMAVTERVSNYNAQLCTTVNKEEVTPNNINTTPIITREEDSSPSDSNIIGTEGSPDIIFETQSSPSQKLIFSDKLKHELNRLRMDIVGGDIPASLTSKRIRKEKFNLSKPRKPRKPRKRLSLASDVELKSKVRSSDNESNKSSNNLLEEFKIEHENTSTNLKPDNAGSPENVEQSPLSSNCETDNERLSQSIVCSEAESVMDSQNTDVEITYENNGQEMVPEMEAENQLPTSEEIIHEDLLCFETSPSESSLQENVAPDTIIVEENIEQQEMVADSAESAISDYIVQQENVADDINRDEVMESEPIKDPLMSISFITSLDINPEKTNDYDDVRTRDTLSIDLNQLETETCGSGKSETVDQNIETDLIPSSPVTNTTPSKNKTFLNDTLDISPIGPVPIVVEFNNSPDLFESETIQVIEKILEGSPCKQSPVAQENINKDEITITADSKQNIDVPKTNSNPFVSYLTPLKLLTSSSVVSSPKTHRIQKMMQKLGDKACSNVSEFKEAVSNYKKEDLLEFSANLPKPDARPRTPSILKRKSPDYADEGISPLSKRKRVNFSDPPTTSSKVYLKSDDENCMQRILKKSGKLSMKPHQVNNQNDMVFNIKVNIKNNTEAQVENEYPDTVKVFKPDSGAMESLTAELSDLYPELIDSTEDVDLLLHNLTNSTVDIKNKGIKTIGDLIRLKRHEIEDLPVSEPKFARVSSTMSVYCSKLKNITYDDYSGENIHKIISVDCLEKSISNVNIINNIILSPKVDRKIPIGLPAICHIIKSNIQQLVNEGYSADTIGEQLNHILRSCDLPLSVNLPYY